MINLEEKTITELKELAKEYNIKNISKLKKEELIQVLSMVIDNNNSDYEENEITNRITIKKLISELKDNEKEVILLRYYKGKTQMQVAKILGITQVQVSRIERKVLDNMKRKLTV